jgi:hypothetical protein
VRSDGKHQNANVVATLREASEVGQEGVRWIMNPLTVVVAAADVSALRDPEHSLEDGADKGSREAEDDSGGDETEDEQSDDIDEPDVVYAEYHCHFNFGAGVVLHAFPFRRLVYSRRGFLL